ncbi:Uncharacterised protein [Vibrio cholerae]|nr:Uncharacterised protein [Vibrio cholerae]
MRDAFRNRARTLTHLRDRSNHLIGFGRVRNQHLFVLFRRLA